MKFNNNGKYFHATASLKNTKYGQFFYRTMFVFNDETGSHALVCESGFMNGDNVRVDVFANDHYEPMSVGTFKEAIQIVELIV